MQRKLAHSATLVLILLLMVSLLSTELTGTQTLLILAIMPLSFIAGITADYQDDISW